ncbi:type II toxin-antitoxin system HipA family toxin [Isoptericola sp. NEAU-Y5]|uniref:Type II toxin-antitoxin system HipA family toxin n=1 Tax=Isoptericola luteus TaxID=2879484 RepID=A0ABS7ZHJ7_9MICO|nr:HipA domain-containing protein [Isoptericola sp. NEAU-Y5]MCA5894503.1 type II toxin-antitoxin system HipA family toxin [Isoptericola sp. NEAU-Y5]
MTSEPRAPERVYVWVWLRGQSEPVVAGALQDSHAVLEGQSVLVFRYAASYRRRPEAVSLFTPELPVSDQVLDPRDRPGRVPLPVAGVLRDAAPDAWGRRVINARLGAEERDLSELTYMLSSGSNRIGAIDFQPAPDEYIARDQDATLEELLELVDLIERGEPVPASLAAAAQHGTSIGGARPKALLQDGDRQLVAKFSSSTDTRPAVQAEAVAMLLARRAGINVPDVEVTRAAGHEVLLLDRFDRVAKPAGEGTARFERRQMITMLTVLGLREMSSYQATYAQLADAVRTGPWTDVRGTLTELYTRLVFNVLVGNNDDHLRNHSAFWDGHRLSLTPAYDLAPQMRSTRTSSQAIGITRDGRRSSQLRLCTMVASDFQLSEAAAGEIVDRVRGAIDEHWDDACDQARLTAAQRQSLMGREFLNPYVFYDEA